MPLIVDKDSKNVAEGLRSSFDICGSPKQARDYIKEKGDGLRKQIPWPSLDTLYHDLNITDELCVAITNSRVNAFKHMVTRHRLGRDGIDHLVEWIIAVRALRYTGKLWQAMITDWRILQK